MSLLPQSPAVVVATVALATAAIILDLSVRKIPNAITFPAAGVGAVLWFQSCGWVGALVATAGAVLCPVLLVIVHGGRRPGMGDLKLAAAVGSVLGPVGGGAAMLVSAALGGVLAIVWMLRPGAPLTVLFLGIPVLERLFSGPDVEANSVPVGRMQVPYGVAIGLGSVVTAAAAGWR
jgi:prepilin peptidase CpaA